MKRIDVVKEISRRSGLIVCTLGFPSRELYRVDDRPENFYMTGSMGMASSIGLGLAVSQKKKVYVIDGDGALLMNLGALVTIAHHAPQNYCLVVVDNGAYASTGNQKTYTADKANLAGLARAAGNPAVVRISTRAALHEALDKEYKTHTILIAEAEPGNDHADLIPLDPPEIKRRFMHAVLQ